MKPAKFDYHAPRTIAETIELLARLGDDAKILAGGQSLVPLLNFRLAAPSDLIDINGVTELGRRSVGEPSVRLGALTRMSAVDSSPEIRAHCPLLAQAAPYIAHPQIRSRGTVGGSLAHADPAAELPGVAVALDATLHVRSTRGERRIPAADFFVYHLTTALEPDELLVEVEVPKAARGQGSCFLEVAARHGDFATAGVAATVTVAADGDITDTVITDARVVCIGVGPAPVRATAAEDVLRGARELDDALAAELRQAVSGALDPAGDLHASAAYKKRVSGVLAAKAVGRALETARGAAA